jgi:hypothetical protein
MEMAVRRVTRLHRLITSRPWTRIHISALGISAE